MKLPEPQSVPFSSLLSDIEKGQTKIPQFQRDFVWDVKASARLMDSIIKGYPIGTFIFWRTNEELRAVRNIGNIRLPDPVEGEYVNYVLDGQQRMTSLFASLRGERIQRLNGKEDDYAEMYIDLLANEDEDIVTVDLEGKDASTLIRLTDLLYGDFTTLSSYPVEYHNKMKNYSKRLEGYNYSVIMIKDAPLDIATEIFTRINVGGKPLSTFEIMVAKTYDHALNFDLSDEFKKLLRRLEPLEFQTINDMTVLQTVSTIITKDCKKQVILKLNKQEFINCWPKAIDAIERAVEYFRSAYGIRVSQLIPYNSLLIPYAYFFYHHPSKPTGEMQKHLRDFFWRVSLVSRYSSALESKMAQDIKKIDSILACQLPKYEWPLNVNEEFILTNGWFNASRSFIKAILCLFASKTPASFNDGSTVNISNYWLKQANSKNYHHFFPRAYLRKKGWEEWIINHIANITIVDDFLNKREIGAHAPSRYMKKFRKENENIDSVMKTHLITDLEKFGVWDDNYETFYTKRIKAIAKEINRFIIPQEVDKTGGETQVIDDSIDQDEDYIDVVIESEEANTPLLN